MRAVVIAALLLAGCAAPPALPAPAAGGLLCLAPCARTALASGGEPAVAVDPANDMHAVVAAMGGASGHIYHPWVSASFTKDGGLTWNLSRVEGGLNDPTSPYGLYDFAADTTVAFLHHDVVLLALAGRAVPPFTCVEIACAGAPVALNSLDLVAWVSLDGGETFVAGAPIAHSTGAAAFAFAGPVGTQVPAGNYPDRETLAADPVTGALTVVWTQVGPSTARPGNQNELLWSSSKDGVAWSTPALLANEFYDAGLALHGDSALLVARDLPTGEFSLFRLQGGTWSPPSPMGESDGYDTPAVALWGAGPMHAAVALPGKGGNGVDLRRSVDGGATWEKAVNLFHGVATTRRLPALAVAASGQGVLSTFQADTDGRLSMRAALLADGSAVGHEISLGNGTVSRSAAFDYTAAAAGARHAYFAWDEDPKGAIQIRAATVTLDSS
ncbi:MAG: hypothetical protein ACYDBQ_11825 [Thermoplasmatota archaeon]